MNYKIINGRILMYNKENDDFFTTSNTLYIRDNKIEHIGEKENDENYEVIDAKDKLIMPGLINMHTHAYMTIFRNYADDTTFDEWLFKKIMPIEDILTKEDAYYTNLLANMEMIKTGTTTYVDMHMYEGASPKACKDSKMRAYISRSVVGESLYEEGNNRFNQMLNEQKEYESDLIKFMIMPHAIYTASTKLIEECAKEANERKMLKQIHLSETNTEVNDCLEKNNVSPVKLLDDIGFLDENTTLAHCVKMIDNDMDILKERKCTVVTNVASNAKLGNGFAPINEMLNKGINVCIGTDGVSSNNTLNMFREMAMLSLIHKGVNEDVLCLSAKTILKMATINAAHALHMDDKLGIIKEDALADLIFIDLTSENLFPNNNVISALVYSANGSEVTDTMINGEFVMRDKKLLTIDKEKVYEEVNKIKDKYLDK
ncbi:MAG: amidohydrolase, partial [Clostridia bacterium]|nr:amidohydrolase [Clostridia bacterium]